MTLSRLPLRGIAVFEAVSRLGSFKAAAQELNLTPSAVSHQIRSLERDLGVDLFTRDGRGVRLSAAASDYAGQVRELLTGIRTATNDIAARGRLQVTTGTVRIMTPPSLATHWLMPRLPAFIEAYPGIDIRVFAIRTADGNVDDFDITIGYGDVARWGGRARPLLEEIIQPYCAPSRLQGAASMRACDLLTQPLIRSGETGISWEKWFRNRDVPFKAEAIHHLQIDPSYVAIEAAVKGIGVILESSILTQEHTGAGRLVSPVSEENRPSVSYWLLPLRSGSRRPVSIAYDWLLSQANFS
ncbi:MAG TPA: LysR family transcriptional regulator [Stellaceae bacterium]|nr:LysR family transcriptional regulator [Stellaceae bacterium]